MKKKFEELISNIDLEIEKSTHQKIFDFAIEHKLYTFTEIKEEDYSLDNPLHFYQWTENGFGYFSRELEKITLDDIKLFYKKQAYLDNLKKIDIESNKLRDWGEIVFWITIIFSLGLLTPLAFLYRRILRGYSILVKHAEINIDKQEVNLDF